MSTELSDARKRCIVVNAHRLLRRKYKGSPLWGLVSDLTGYGCTMSVEFCKALNLHPVQDCWNKQLEPYT